MKADWPVARCVLCLSEGTLCEEHIIPRALGGIFTCSFLCHDCNSRLGSDVEASAKSDPSILLAVDRLQGDIPALAHKSRPYVTIGEGPRVSVYVRDGAFQVEGQKHDDGSTILPTDEAPKAIVEMLQRSGYAETPPIQHVLSVLKSAPDSQRISVAPECDAIKCDVIKWPVEAIEPDLSKSMPIDPRLPAKIAFEFLALCAGEAICTNDGPLPDLRQILESGTGWDDTILRVDRLRVDADDARPFHGICNEENREYEQIQVRLFGCVGYRVHFPGLYIGGPRYAYTHWLNTNTRKEDLRMIK